MVLRGTAATGALVAVIALSHTPIDAQQGPGRGAGAGGAAQTPGAARGQVRPECANPVIPAAECGIWPGVNWPDPPLGPGPFLLQTAVPQHRNIRVVVVANGLNQPWSLAWLPDGTMLVTERAGRLRVVRNGVLDPAPVAGLPDIHAQGIQGLMDVAVHPRFAENRWIYLSYHKPFPVSGATAPGGGPLIEGETVLARGTWDGKALTDVRDIFRSGATRTESSRMGWGRDGMLYMSVSASGTGPDVLRSADLNDYAGKTVRLRDDGTIPPDNPFAGKPGHKPGIYTYGHRNGHSMALNPETGQFWVTEMGPDGGDEINILRPGANYGWPHVSFGRNYMGPRISAAPAKEGTEQPWVAWLPSISVTGGTFYTGDRFPGWRRNFFVGGLREGETPRTGQLQRIEFNERWEEVRREPLLRDLHQRIRDVRQGPDGLLYVVTGENPGAVLRIEPGEPASQP